MDLLALIRYQNYLSNRGAEGSWHTWDAPVKLLNLGFAPIQQGYIGFDLSLKSLQEIEIQVQGWGCFKWPKDLSVPSAVLLTRVGSSRFYVLIAGVWVPSKAQSRAGITSCSGLRPALEWQGRVSLWATWEAQNKKCLKYPVPAKAGLGGD